ENKKIVDGANRSSIGLTKLQFKTIDGLKIRYVTDEATKGDLIVLLCPWPESIYAFLPTWQTFTALGPVVAVDLPGFGRSESRPDVMAAEAMGEFIPQLLEAFGIHQPHVAGPDVGTPALLFAAANHPGIFKSLIIGSGATDHTDIGGILDELVNAPSLEPYKNLTGEEFVRGAISDMKKYQLPDYALQDYLASYAGNRFFESVKFVRDYPRSLPRLAKRLPEIKVPCQITVGRHDPFVPVSNAEGLRRGLPKSKLDILDCGHFAWEDGAADYGRLASEWIKGGYAKL
ncbi:MAG: alpha/beta hydrolase, partial [Xanthobacteraceae bacterium]